MMNSDWLLGSVKVFDRAVEVWGTPERAMEWLQCRDRDLGAKPGELAETTEGLVQVLHCLRRIELDERV
ncbi:MbcA/ParS/Xre antitoxin family protein [Azospirillum sp. TSO35-2]|uniref:MbcA/ParS/Xre antitoxin family protein n=1 Tax=Azospirillum sp. TSO35-2 TaxID=716796 RepID=UPI000D604086|nr:MbcA/ParS/Xre antitoxin family protein [Azospirillum sp. TSO35-2]PWC37903.1 hypothetical protein TSO352_10695 [Azospirillum sp. TSO35-2]